MRLHCRSGRVSPSWWVWLALLVSALAPWPSSLAAQQPDTIPPDTLPTEAVEVAIPPESVVSDTLPADSAMLATPDSLLPAPRFPDFPRPYTAGFAASRWEWTRADLHRFHGLSLLDLLDQIPGLIVTRSGGFGRPAGLSFLDTGGGVLRVFRDGFEVDPLTSATLDLQHLGLADLESVRVHRLPGEVRVELSTLQLDDRLAYSQVEAGTGNYEAKILRALFSRAVGSRSLVTAAYDLTTTNGFTANEPFSFGSGRVRWSYALAERAGLQAEFRQAAIQREGTLFPEETTRRELVLRGRAELFPGLTVDGLVARTTSAPDGGEAEEDQGFDSGTPASGRLVPTLASTQASLRAGYQLGPGFLEASARVRGGDAAGRLLPGTDLAVRGVLQPLGWVGVEGEARSVSVEQGQATRLLATVRLGPVRGLTLFAGASAGERWAGTVTDTFELRAGADTTFVGGTPIFSTDTVAVPLFGSARASAAGLRVGAEWAGWGARIGGALLTSGATVTVPYGLPFDRGVEAEDVGAASGVEAYATLPLPFWKRSVRLDGSYVRWLETGGRPYLPVEQARAAVEFHGVFVGGQLEPTLRVEALYRGSALAPLPTRDRFGAATDGYALANLYLQIRILDVRAFLIYQNLLNNRLAVDVPGTPLPGPLLLYGIRWHFLN